MYQRAPRSRRPQNLRSRRSPLLSHQPKTPDVAIPDDTTWEDLTPQQRWYYKNREHRIHVKEQRRKNIARWLYEYKRDHCACELCGETDPACIVFHHDDDKKHNISWMVSHGYAIENIKAEIKKCRVLCANCHRKVHQIQHGSSRVKSENAHKTDGLYSYLKNYNSYIPGGNDSHREKMRRWIYCYKAKSDGCDCGERHPIALEFHRKDSHDKTASVSDIINGGASKQRTLNEIQNASFSAETVTVKLTIRYPNDPNNSY